MKLRSIILLTTLCSTLLTIDSSETSRSLHDLEYLPEINTEYSPTEHRHCVKSSALSALDIKKIIHTDINTLHSHTIQRKQDNWALTAKDSHYLARTTNDVAHTYTDKNRARLNQAVKAYKILGIADINTNHQEFMKAHNQILAEENAQKYHDSLWTRLKIIFSTRFAKLPFLPQLIGSIHDFFNRKSWEQHWTRYEQTHPGICKQDKD